MQFTARLGCGDLLQEPQEPAVPVAVVADVGDRAGGHLQGGEQGGGAVPDLVMGMPLGGYPGVSAEPTGFVPGPGSGASRRRRLRSRSAEAPGTGPPHRGPWPPTADRWRTEPSVLAGGGAPIVGGGEGQLCAQAGPRSRRDVEKDPAAECLHAVPEAGQAGTAGEVGTAGAVVADYDAQEVAVRLDL